MENDFVFYFNRKKQWSKVYLWDVHQNTFANWRAGRWAYFLPVWENCKYGLFSELHFVKSRLRFDTISHELDHLRTEWMWANGITITRKNEEKMAEFLDLLTRNFLRELRKIDPKVKL